MGDRETKQQQAARYPTFIPNGVATVSVSGISAATTAIGGSLLVSAPRHSASTFARNLELIRVAKGYTQENLAFDADVSRSHFSNIKGAENSPTLEMVDKLARALGVESWQMLVPDLIVESLEPGSASSNAFIPPSTLKVVRDQDSKRLGRAITELRS